MVALLRPRIGEKQVQAGQRAVRDHPFQHLDRIVPDHAQVLQAEGLDTLQQAADAGSVHFDGSLVCCEGHLNPEGAVIFGNALIERT